MAKIRPGGVVGDSPSGTTFEKSKTHAPTMGRGTNTTPKDKIPVNGVVGDSPHGVTFDRVGIKDTDIDMPNADKKPKESKVISSGEKKAFIPDGKGLYPNPGSREMPGRGYMKSGRGDKTKV